MVGFILLGLVGFLAVSGALGQGYLAHGQLQTAADSAAKAAIGVMKEGRGVNQAADAAKVVGNGTRALELPNFFTDDQIQFGDYEHQSDNFRAGGDEHQPAVRIHARRMESVPGGAIDLIMGGLLGRDTIDLEASATATTGCREIVFAIDASEGMAQEITDAYDMVDGFVNWLRRFGRAGDKVGITIYAGDGLSMREYAGNGGPFWARPVPEELSRIPAKEADISNWISAMNTWGNYCDDPRDRSDPDASKLPTLGRGSCLGKGDHHGIYQAMNMFDDLNDRCSSEGERLIVLITSDVPCAWQGWHVGDTSGRRYGGTTSDAYQAANAASAAGIHIQPILIDGGSAGNCPTTGEHAGQHAESAASFVNNMARGFPVTAGTGAMINPAQMPVNRLIDELNKVLFVRLVQ
jgi:hypothetical protein